MGPYRALWAHMGPILLKKSLILVKNHKIINENIKIVNLEMGVSDLAFLSRILNVCYDYGGGKLVKN